MLPISPTVMPLKARSPKLAMLNRPSVRPTDFLMCVELHQGLRHGVECELEKTGRE